MQVFENTKSGYRVHRLVWWWYVMSLNEEMRNPTSTCLRLRPGSYCIYLPIYIYITRPSSLPKMDELYTTYTLGCTLCEYVVYTYIYNMYRYT